MRAVAWYGKEDVRVVDAPDPTILTPRDAVVRVTSTAICGSDLHLYDGHMPTMRQGDILGHEFMGEVVEVGPRVEGLQPGDRVVVPFTISCGGCRYCREGLYALCDNSNPNHEIPELAYGASPGGFFGYSHAFGGYAGGQAEYVRVPFADVGALKVPGSLDDEQVLFLSDVLPTAWQAVEQCELRPGANLAVWGCGPVGLLAIASARLLGAGQVFAVDRFPERLRLAEALGATPMDYEDDHVVDRLRDLTGGRGPDACIDAAGMEAHGDDLGALYDRAKQTVRLESDRGTALRQAVRACRKGGVVSVPGVYGGFVDKFPMGALFGKGLTMKAGQTNVQRHMRPLLQRIERGELDPSFIVTHRMGLEEAPEAYRLFRDKQDECVKVVLTP